MFPVSWLPTLSLSAPAVRQLERKLTFPHLCLLWGLGEESPPLWPDKAWGLLDGKEGWVWLTPPWHHGERRSEVWLDPEAQLIWDVTASPSLLQAEQKHRAEVDNK